MTDWKDFKNSYAQRKWEHAVSKYARMRVWLTRYGNKDDIFYNPTMLQYATEAIAELEREYPMLAVVSSDTDGILK